MKRGIEALNSDYPQRSKKAKIKKSLETLLEEVNQGNYVDFREYLIQEELTELNWYKKGRKFDLAHLSSALQGTKIIGLMLICNEIDGAGIAKLNLQGTQVTYLNLSYNQIGAGVANLNLRDTQVTYLNLASNQIGAGVASLNLKDTRVNCLILSGNHIGAGIANLRLQDTKVTDLNLESNRIGHGDIGKLHLQGTQVVELGLGSNNISKGLANLHLQDTEVTKLNLRNNNIGPDEITRLNLKDTNVTDLDLEKNNIGDGIANLHLQGTQVSYLNLKWNFLDIVDVTTFAQKILSTSLLEVELNGKWDELKEALQSNKQALINKPLSVLWESYSERKDSKPAKTLAKCREAGVLELQDLILSKLPGMAITTQYQDKKMPMGQLLQQLAKDEVAKITTAKNKLI